MLSYLLASLCAQRESMPCHFSVMPALLHWSPAWGGGTVWENGNHPFDWWASLSSRVFTIIFSMDRLFFFSPSYMTEMLEWPGRWEMASPSWDEAPTVLSLSGFYNKDHFGLAFVDLSSLHLPVPCCLLSQIFALRMWEPVFSKLNAWKCESAWKLGLLALSHSCAYSQPASNRSTNRQPRLFLDPTASALG